MREVLFRVESQNSASAADHPEVRKNFYIEHPQTASRTPVEVEQIRRRNNNISVIDLCKGCSELQLYTWASRYIVLWFYSDKKRDTPNPVLHFEEAFEHYPEIMKCIQRAGFVEPSPIQKQSWPIALLVSQIECDCFP